MNKKGFTLVELLGTIALIAIVISITLVVVNKMQEQATKDTKVQSAMNIIKTVKQLQIENSQDSSVKEYAIDLSNENVIKYDGEKPTSGAVLITKDAKVSITMLIDKYCVEKKFDEDKPSIVKKEICTIDESELNKISNYKENILKGTDPVLSDKLVPVTIESNGVVKAANPKFKWYSYESKEWANAVLLETPTTYNYGDTISESNINSYYVWIPRYRYQLFSDDSSVGKQKKNEQTIEIEFEPKEITPKSGTQKGEYLTHPSFVNFNTNGFWISKFETGYKGATSVSTSQVNAIDTSKVISKPNAYSWRSITLGNAFKTSYNYKRDLNSHLMMNTEAGALIYLSSSKYGINEQMEVNTSERLTGCGDSRANITDLYSVCKKKYGQLDEYPQSTTGNITGVFDASGGSREFVSAYNKLATTVGGSSGLTQTDLNTYAKYIDIYSSISDSNFNQKINGDATGELGPFISIDGGMYKSSWYENISQFIDKTRPWFDRGMNEYDFALTNGEASSFRTFRIVLSF